MLKLLKYIRSIQRGGGNIQSQVTVLRILLVDVQRMTLKEEVSSGISSISEALLHFGLLTSVPLILNHMLLSEMVQCQPMTIFFHILVLLFATLNILPVESFSIASQLLYLLTI